MTNKMACAPSEDSAQAGHPPSLIRVFGVRINKAWVLSYPLSARRRLIRLGGCRAHIIVDVLSCCGSINIIPVQRKNQIQLEKRKIHRVKINYYMQMGSLGQVLCQISFVKQIFLHFLKTNRTYTCILLQQNFSHKMQRTSVSISSFMYFFK